MSWDSKMDRRHHRRAPIRIVSEFGEGASATRIETANLSAGGFSCWIEHPIQPLTKLALRFEFPAFGAEAGRPVDCEAVVVRCERRKEAGHRWSVAAAFLGLREEDRDFINRYVAWHETVSAPADADEEPLPTQQGRAAARD